MLRLLLLLAGAPLLKSRWMVLVVSGLLWTGMGIAIFCDIAHDGLLSFPLSMLALVLLVEGLVDIAAAFISGPPFSNTLLARGAIFIIIAVLVFICSDDGSLVIALLFGCAFMLDGLFRAISTGLMRCRLWRKKMLFGLLELLFSLMIFCNWPFHHDQMVAFCFAALTVYSGLSLLTMAQQIWRLPANTSVTMLPMFTSRGLRRPHGTAYQHPAFPAAEPETPMQILIWTPAGSAMVNDRHLLVDRYLAAIDGEGTIATGHAALELSGQLYISHYPQDDIDRDFSNFRAALRAGEEYDVPGCFLPSLKQEIDDWCIPDRRLTLRHYNVQALRNYWQIYSSDTTYNLTSRNCSTTVVQALDVAVEGALGRRGSGVFSLLINPDFWLLWLVRSRAEGMTWTPGLLLDYVHLLKKVLEPAPSRAWHKRVQAALMLRRQGLMTLRLQKSSARSRGHALQERQSMQK